MKLYPSSEAPREFRRRFGLSQATMADPIS
jgi:DNA-binding XRE family transcriptional regulator